MNINPCLSACCLLWLAGSPGISAAAPQDCVRVAQASVKRLDAAAFYLVQEMPGLRSETIKQGGQWLHRADGEPWKNIAGQTKAMRRAAERSQSLLTACAREGSGESFEGEATDVYRFNAPDMGGGTVVSRVWIGRNSGLPYREVAGEVRGSTRYTNLPKVAP
jgi:hypothetical protein